MTLALADFQRAAAQLNVPVAAVRAVTEVESRGSGFLADGKRPVILFERHVFSKRTGGQFDAEHPDVSNPKPGGYKGGAAEHERLERAAALDRDAALSSCSWGLFQIMGYHHAACGHPTLQSFVNAMYAGEGAQLDAFVQFIKYDPRLLRALRALDWTAFARAYNGPGYAVNSYDVKMAAAYRRFS